MGCELQVELKFHPPNPRLLVLFVFFYLLWFMFGMLVYVCKTTLLMTGMDRNPSWGIWVGIQVHTDVCLVCLKYNISLAQLYAHVEAFSVPSFYSAGRILWSLYSPGLHLPFLYFYLIYNIFLPCLRLCGENSWLLYSKPPILCLWISTQKDVWVTGRRGSLQSWLWVVWRIKPALHPTPHKAHLKA